LIASADYDFMMYVVSTVPGQLPKGKIGKEQKYGEAIWQDLEEWC